MRIILMQPGQPVADFSVSGTTIIVAGVVIDCAERQRSHAVTVEIRLKDGQAVEGDTGAYLAQIQIPAQEHEAVQDAPGNQAPGNQAPGATGMESSPSIRALPLDPRRILVTLWPSI